MKTTMKKNSAFIAGPTEDTMHICVATTIKFIGCKEPKKRGKYCKREVELSDEEKIALILNTGDNREYKRIRVAKYRGASVPTKHILFLITHKLTPAEITCWCKNNYPKNKEKCRRVRNIYLDIE